MVGRNWRIALGEGHLHLARAAQCIDDAGEFDEQTVAGCLDEAASALGDFRIEELATQRPEPFERALLVRAHQPRVARHIGGEDRGETAFDASWPCGLHGASPVPGDPTSTVA